MCNKKIFLLLLFAFSVLVTFSQSKIKLINKLVSFGMKEAKSRTINSIIIHSVYNAMGGDKYDIGLIINQFSFYNVSSHYAIGRDGTIYQLVKEKNIAFHAGKSCLPNGQIGVNSCSVGIELITTNDSIDTPTERQIHSLEKLVKNIKSRHQIKYVLRHSDIAPGRKTDPWNLNWDEFIKRI